MARNTDYAQSCQKCGGPSSVVDCRGLMSERVIRRRRECRSCRHRWSTYEREGRGPLEEAAIAKATAVLERLIARREAEKR